MRLLLLVAVFAARTAVAGSMITPLVTPGGAELPAPIAASAFCDANATAAIVLRNGDVFTIDRSETLTQVLSLGHNVSGMPGLLCDQAGRIALAAGGVLTTIDGTVVSTAKGGPTDVRGSRVLDDGSLAFVDRSGTVWKWDGTSFTTWTFKAPGFLWSLSINRDGTAVATTIRDRVTVFESAGTTVIGPTASGVAWSNDGGSLLLVGKAGLERWKLGTPIEKRESLDAGVTGMRIQASARYALAWPRPSHMEVRELDTKGKVVGSSSISRIPFDVMFYTFGTTGFAVGTSSRRAWVIQLTKSHEVLDHTHPIATVRNMAFSPTGKTIAFLGGDDDVLVAPVDGRRPSRRTAQPGQLIGNIVGWLADGTVLAGGAFSFVQLQKNGTSNASHTGLVIGLTPTGEMIESTRDHHVIVHGTTPVSIATSIEPIPVGAADMAGKFLELRKQRHVEVWDLGSTTAPVLTSTDQRWISGAALVGTQPSVMFATDRSLRLLDATGERVVDTMHSPATVLVASPDRHRVAIGSPDGVVSIYDDAGTKLFEGTSPSGMMINAIAWSPDQTHVAVATQAGIELWLLP